MLPNTLMYLVDRLAGFSTNVLKINPVGSTAVNSRGIVEFNLPANLPINLASFKVFFTATCSGAASGGRLPANIHSLISKVEVSAGGILLSQGSDYFNVMTAAKEALMGSKACPVLGHPEVVRIKSYVDDASITSTGFETIVSSTNPVFCWENFDGFLQTSKPFILDTGLIPQVRVRITLAGPEVLAAVKTVAFADFVDDSAAGNADYSVSNLSATIEAVSFGDSTYQEVSSALIQKKGFLEISYKNYYSFSSTHTGSSNWNVSTQSLDRVWWAMRTSGFDTQGKAVKIAGHKGPGGWVNNAAAITSSTLTTEAGIPDYDVEMYNTNSEKYTTKYFNFADPSLSSGDSSMTAQLKLNNASYPEFPATASQWLGVSKNSLPLGEKLRVMAPQQYLTNYFVGCARFNFPGSEEMRLVSGVDCRGVNLAGSFNTSGISTCNLTIICETTATLKVGAGRQIAVDY